MNLFWFGFFYNSIEKNAGATSGPRFQKQQDVVTRSKFSKGGIMSMILCICVGLVLLLVSLCLCLSGQYRAMCAAEQRLNAIGKKCDDFFDVTVREEDESPEFVAAN